jgi:hypothetical protein
MSFHNELKLLLDARIAVVNIVTSEEARVLEELTALTREPGWPPDEGLYTWDIFDQFVCIKPARDAFNTRQEASPDTILRLLRDYRGGATFVLKDFHQVWEAKRGTLRGLRNLAASLPASQPRRNLIITTPDFCLPVELKHDIPVLELPKPRARELQTIIEQVAGASGALRSIKETLLGKLVEAALGLNSIQARRVFQKAVVAAAGQVLDERCIDLIREEKRSIIRESGALELYPHIEPAGHVGGLEVLKSWLQRRSRAFTPEAHEYGLSWPQGVALIGIPGTGKSLCAKVTAGTWKLPLLRLDMGAVFGGILGVSEKNLREAMQIAEVIAPCVLWVDEVEKAFAGSSGDSGTAGRILGTFLTWMQEKQAPVFVLATANAVHHLPPEFLRKGRFDEVFFLDLPTRLEREQILEVHLKKRRLNKVRERFDLPAIARATEGFVGAELEAVVNEAMFPAFMDHERMLETEDLLTAARDMVPLAKSHHEHIRKLRQIVIAGEARNASRTADDEEVKIEQVRGERTGGGRLVDV